MRYTAILNGQKRELEIIQLEPYRFQVLVDDELYEVDARLCGADLLSILIDNASYGISFSYENSHVMLNFKNQHFHIEVIDEKREQMRKVGSEINITGPEIIKTSMPGKIIKVLVEEGQTLEPGAGVIIIEAMKMENEIRCRGGGRVKAVHITAGQTVEGGTAMVEIEPEHVQD